MKVALFHHNLIQVNNAKRGHKYLCPLCHRIVVIHQSNNKCRFFVHYHMNTNCGGESSEHLKGKMQIANFFYHYFGNIKIEEYLPQIHQWPDILINDSTAVEFQCSPIDHRTLKSRINGYLKMDLKSWWILGKPYYYRKLGIKYLERFMRYSLFVGFYLTFWLTKVNCLELHYQFREVHGKMFHQTKRIYTFKELNHFFHSYHLKTSYCKDSINEDVRSIQKRLFHRDLDTIHLQLELNQTNHTVDSCPLICHKMLVNPPIFKGKMLLWHIWILILLQSNNSLEMVYKKANNKLNLPLNFIQIWQAQYFYYQTFNKYIRLLVLRGYLIINGDYIAYWKMPIWFNSCYDKQYFLRKVINKDED